MLSTPAFPSSLSFSPVWHNSFCPRCNWGIIAWRWSLFTQPLGCQSVSQSVNLWRWHIIIYNAVRVKEKDKKKKNQQAAAHMPHMNQNKLKEPSQHVLMWTTVNLRCSHDTYTVWISGLSVWFCFCSHVQDRKALACLCSVYMCVLLKVVLSSDRKLIVWVLVNDPQEKETKSVKQVAQNKDTPLSRGHTGSLSSQHRSKDHHYCTFSEVFMRYSPFHFKCNILGKKTDVTALENIFERRKWIV